MAQTDYPATLEIQYPTKLNRETTFFRLFLALPIFILIVILTGGDNSITTNGTVHIGTGSGVIAGITIATALMIFFRQRYPKWWFDFALELHRFGMRVRAYLFLLTDKYPSTVEAQSVTMNLRYPDAEKDLNQYMPLFKWILVFPHYIVLFILYIGLIFSVIVAWFSIIFTGKYPPRLFNYVVGVNRWEWRVVAYAHLLATDEYPPFSLR
ncbi:MAG TPA: DUF4389 domain-containing protein [Candidatus Saccharimonadales bacterium]|nr:DUF4389 domain-containing protein [Candidatus Saccharimonadales bacterium]